MSDAEMPRPDSEEEPSGEVQLPVVDARTTLSAALAEMRRIGRSGLVFMRGGEPVLLTLEDLTRAWREEKSGSRQVGHLRPQEPAASISVASSSEWGAGASSHGRGSGDFASHLDDAADSHRIAAATVIPASDKQYHLLFETPVGCMCKDEHILYSPAEARARGYKCEDCERTVVCE